MKIQTGGGARLRSKFVFKIAVLVRQGERTEEKENSNLTNLSATKFK